MADWCYANNLTPVIVDNNSDYPPLLEYYNTCPYDVLRMTDNYGHTVIWNKELNILGKLGIKGRYIVSDSDLDLQGIPSDFLSVLNKGLDQYSRVAKCGFSLEIKDLPNSKEGNFIKNRCEIVFWKHKIRGGYYLSPIDTTFALYREDTTSYTHRAIRTDRPYTARHMPWYYTDITALPEDEQYYYKTADIRFSTGKKRGFVS